MDELYQAIERCDGCAFTPGTPASQHENTQLTIKLCLQACRPFYCHEHAQELSNLGLPLSAAIDQARREGRFPMCRGYVDAMTALHDKGHYSKETEWKQELAGKMIDLLDEAEEKGYTPEQSELALMKMMKEFLSA